MAEGALGKLVVSLEANIARFEQDLTKAENLSKLAMQGITRTTELATTATQALGTALAGIGVGLSFESVIEKFNSVAETMAHLQHASEITGASVENLSAIGQVAKVVGTAFDQVEVGMTKLAKSMASATDSASGTGRAFAVLGLNAAQLRTMDTADAFKLVADRLNDYADGSGKTAIAQALLGRSGAQLLPVMKELAENGDLVAKTTTEQATNALDYEKALNRLAIAKNALAKIVVAEMLPAAASFIKAIVALRTETESTQSKVKALAEDGSIKSWAKSAAEAVGHVVDAFDGVSRVAQTIGDAIGRDLAKFAIWYEAFKGSGALPMDQWLARYQEANAKMEQMDKASAARREAIWTAPTFSQKLQQQFVKDDAAAATPKEKKPQLNFTTTDPNAEVPLKNLSATTEQLTRLAERELEALNLSTKMAREFDKASNVAITMMTVMPESKRQMLLAFARIDEEAARRRDELAKSAGRGDIDAGVYAAALAKVTAEVERERAATEALIAKQAALNASWQYGASKAMQAYLDDVANVAKSTEALMTKAFKGMEDALVTFVKTGKLDFKSLADSIITDIIRIQIQQSIMKPLTNALSGGNILSTIGSWFGGAKASGGPVEAGTTYLVGENGPELFTPPAAGHIVPNGTGGNNYAVSITVNGGTSQTKGDVSQLGQMAKQLEAAIKTVLVNEQRNGGILAA